MVAKWNQRESNSREEDDLIHSAKNELDPLQFPLQSHTLAKANSTLTFLESWRRGWDSNPRMEVLQTSPLGHLGTAPNE